MIAAPYTSVAALPQSAVFHIKGPTVIGSGYRGCMDAGTMVLPSFPRDMSAVLLCCALVQGSGVAFAADAGKSAVFAPERIESASSLSEIRLGVLAHDPWSPEHGSVDINGEFVLKKLFRAPDPLTDMLIPRLHLGGSFNTNGRTSNGYAGLTWSYDVTSSLFVEFAFGGALNNGSTGNMHFPRHSSVGCRQSFREAGSIGWRLAPNLAVMATLEHYSNAGICSQNRGITNLGARLSYSF